SPSSRNPNTLNITPHTRCREVPMPNSLARPTSRKIAGHHRMIFSESRMLRLSSVKSTPSVSSTIPNSRRPSKRRARSTMTHLLSDRHVPRERDDQRQSDERRGGDPRPQGGDQRRRHLDEGSEDQQRRRRRLPGIERQDQRVLHHQPHREGRERQLQQQPGDRRRLQSPVRHDARPPPPPHPTLRGSGAAAGLRTPPSASATRRSRSGPA